MEQDSIMILPATACPTGMGRGESPMSGCVTT
nr:MAG TPA: hypothetical protein [Caudoviricetes sp.]